MWCLRCDYELHATPDGRCPECGRVFARNNPKSYKLHGDLPHERRLFVVALVCAGGPLAPAAWMLDHVLRSGGPIRALLAVRVAWLLFPLVFVGLGLCCAPELRRRPTRRNWVCVVAILSIIVCATPVVVVLVNL